MNSDGTDHNDARPAVTVGPGDFEENILPDERLRLLYRYWLGKRAGGRLPARTDIDPTDIPSILPFLILIDVTEDSRYFFRLFGTQVAAWTGVDMTGRYLGEGPDSPNEAALAPQFLSVVESGLPRYDELAATLPNREHQNYRRLLLPLSSDGEKIDTLLAQMLLVA